MIDLSQQQHQQQFSSHQPSFLQFNGSSHRPGGRIALDLDDADGVIQQDDDDLVIDRQTEEE